MSQLDSTGTVVPFQYGNTAVRTVLIDGEPWFVLADLCRPLGLSNPSMVADRVESDALSSAEVIDSMGREQSARIVSEAGMYEVVLMSRKPEARMFKRWLTGTVLPEIHRTGSYNAPVKPALTDDEIVHRALQIQTRKIEALTERVAELAPKADLADNYLTAQGGARLVREVAKPLGMKERDLRRFLLDEKLTFTKHAPCGDVQYDHYAQFAHHFQARETVVNHTWGTCSHYTLYILPRGVELIRKRMADAGSLVLA